MAKRYRASRKGKDDLAGLWFAVAIAVVAFLIFFATIIIISVVVVGSAFLIIKYFNWQGKRIEHHKSWTVFWEQELKSIVFRILAWSTLVVGIVLFFLRPAVGFAVVCISLPFFPSVGKLIKERFPKNQFTIKLLLLIAFAFLAIMANLSYVKEEAVQNLNDQEEKRKLEVLALKKENELAKRRDSATHFLNLSLKQVENRQYKKALDLIDKSISLNPENKISLSTRGNLLKSMGRYDEAISTFEKVDDAESLYKIAQCFLKKNKDKAAISYFKKAADRGHRKASNAYDKYNPIIKEIVGYVTRCCDGSTSNSTGRGTCSHHGGVCNWRDPIYQERRKYE